MLGYKEKLWADELFDNAAMSDLESSKITESVLPPALGLQRITASSRKKKTFLTGISGQFKEKK